MRSLPRWASAGYDVERMRLVERRDYVIDCNWKVYVDNYLEGYHIPIVHPRLFRELDYESYRVEEIRYYSMQHAPIRELKPARSAGRSARRPPARRDDGPLLLALPEPDAQHLPGQHVDEPHPAARPRTDADDLRVVSSASPLGPGWEVDEQTIAFSDEIQHEDIDICEKVQRGLGLATYQAGRFSAKRENGVHHFQNLVPSSSANDRPSRRQADGRPDQRGLLAGRRHRAPPRAAGRGRQTES